MAKQEACPICSFPNAIVEKDLSRGVSYIECKRCGGYEISDILKQFGKEKLSVIGYILSGLSRELAETGENFPKFLPQNIDELSKNYPVPDISNIEEKAKKLLQRLKERTESFGDLVTLSTKDDYPLAYAKKEDELIALIRFLAKKDFLSIKSHTTGDITVVLEAEGWDFVNTLQKVNKESIKGFVAIWFDKTMNESMDAICSAIKETGFDPICIYNEHFSETIMDKALGEIKESKFLVVDLTGNRPSVFFEAGFAHGHGIEIIYVYKKDEEQKFPLEFYVRHYKCYDYTDPDDLKNKLVNAIKARIK
jgi:hypothetical protein